MIQIKTVEIPIPGIPEFVKNGIATLGWTVMNAATGAMAYHSYTESPETMPLVVEWGLIWFILNYLILANLKKLQDKQNLSQKGIKNE